MATADVQSRPLDHMKEELTKQQQLHIDALGSVDPLLVSEAEYHLAAQVFLSLRTQRSNLIHSISWHTVQVNTIPANIIS